MKYKLSWPANPESELITVYKVWESISGGAFAVKGVVSVPEILFNPVPAETAYKVQAGNAVGYGPDSAVLNGPGLPSAPGGLTLEVVEDPA